MCADPEPQRGLSRAERQRRRSAQSKQVHPQKLKPEYPKIENLSPKPNHKPLILPKAELQRPRSAQGQQVRPPKIETRNPPNRKLEPWNSFWTYTLNHKH